MLFAPDWTHDTSHLGDNEPPPAREMFARWADDLLSRGSSTDALERTRSGTDQFPSYAAGWFIRARAEMDCGHLARATASVERCLALEPHFHAAWDLLARLCELRQRPAAARAARQRLTELLPESVRIQATTTEHTTAHPAPDSEPEPLSTPFPEPPPELATDDTAEPSAPQSDEHRRLVLRAAPGTLQAFETPTLAEVYRRQGLLDRALEVYSRILERHPDDAAARSMVTKLEAELAARRRPAEHP